MKELYSHLQNYFQFDKKDFVIITLFKSIVILFGGALLGVIINDYGIHEISYIKIFLFFILLTIYSYLEYKSLIKQKKFPISILEHLNAKEDLQILDKQYSRQKKIFEFIDNSIKSLNTNTCPISYDSEPELICRDDLNGSLSDLLNDFINRTNYFLEVDKLNFTNGIYLDDLLTYKNNVFIKGPIDFIFRDDLKLTKYFSDYELSEKEKELQFHIKSTINESILFSKYICKQIDFGANNYTIIISAIPNICEECPSRGVIYAIYEGNETCNCDSNKILEILCTILTNWISKYEDCLFNEYKSEDKENGKTHNYKKIEIPEEVKKSQENKNTIKN